jgi:hypothetical protein
LTGVDSSAIAALTRRWVDQFVIGENLCPFAAPALRLQPLRIEVCVLDQEDALVAAVLRELDLLQSTPERELVTSVLVFPNALSDFESYLDFAALAEELLETAGLEGTLQIATFHPQYCFADAAPDDVSNYTNRSPYPMLHFLREDALTRALEHVPQPEAIPQRNIAHLRALGLARVQQMLRDIHEGQ